MKTPFVGFHRLADGQVAELWVEGDNINAVTQLGHLPPPVAPEG